MAQPPSHTPRIPAPSSFTATSIVPSGHVQTSGSSNDQGATLVEMLNRIDEFESIPQLHISHPAATSSEAVPVVPMVTSVGGVKATTALTVPQPSLSAPSDNEHLLINQTSELNQSLANQTPELTQGLANQTSEIPAGLILQLPTDLPAQCSTSPEKKSRVGRPRVKPPRERQAWHYHLGGVRHCRIPLTPELREVLEVAYVSRIMSKNFRKEGQPEKERIARITGMELDKVQEWFKNRRKKDKLQKDRLHGVKTPRGRRGQRSTTESISQSSLGDDEATIVMETNQTRDNSNHVPHRC